VANTPSAIKRVRQNARRVAINGPRRTAAKTYVAKALRVAGGTAEGDPATALAEAMSALDRAAKTGAIHPNAAARRKSRLALKINATLGGVSVETAARVRPTGKAAAAKAARARVAASKARAEAGPKTAAGKARVALARTATGGAKSGAKASGAANTSTTAGASPKVPAQRGATKSRSTAGKASPAKKSGKSAGGSSS
jgi:small subunit ribosomal protein S20